MLNKNSFETKLKQTLDYLSNEQLPFDALAERALRNTLEDAKALADKLELSQTDSLNDNINIIKS